MKKILIKITTLSVYSIALLWLVDFKFFMLIDLKMILMVLLGTSLLTLGSYKKGFDLNKLLAAARWNAQITGYLVTFFLEFALLSSDYEADILMYGVAINLRPLLYALLLNILFTHILESKKSTIKDIPVTIKQEYIEGGNLDELFVGALLTEREVAVARGILEDLSNKEIGDKLFISENTVKKHIYNLFKKLEISNREQLKQLLYLRGDK